MGKNQFLIMKPSQFEYVTQRPPLTLFITLLTLNMSQTY